MENSNFEQSNEPPQIKSPVKTEQNHTEQLGDIIGGSSTRQYLNDKVTPTLLRGMRQIAIDKPANPLKALGEYLIAESERQQ